MRGVGFFFTPPPPLDFLRPPLGVLAREEAGEEAAEEFKSTGSAISVRAMTLRSSGVP